MANLETKNQKFFIAEEDVCEKNIFVPSVNAGLGKNLKQHLHLAHLTLPT